MFYACLLSCGDGVLVLLKAAAGAIHRIGADEQEAGGALEGFRQTGGVVKIRSAHLYALGGEVCEFFRIAGGGDDFAGWNLVGFQEVADNELAQMAGGAGDEIHRFDPFVAMVSN
jgi:hypothetical protein